MRSTFVASLGLAWGLLVSGAMAEESEWRPATPVAATESSPVVGLKPPMPAPAGSGVRQTVFANAPALDFSPSARTQVLETPGQPLPIGPILKEEKGPAPTPLINTPPPPVAEQPHVIGAPVQGFVSSPFEGGFPGAPSCGCGSSYAGAPPHGFGGDCNDGCGSACCGDCCGTCGPCCVSDDCCGCCAGPCCWDNICDACCGCCCGDCCAPRSCFWVRGEYLLWTVKDGPTPPLVTMNRNGAAPVIGVPGTQTVFGGTSEDFNLRSGGRFTIGFALPCTENKLGFEATYFFLADRTAGSTFGSDGNPTIGRPFTDVGPGLSGFPGNQNAELVAFPGLVNGTVRVNTSNEIWGVEGNIRYPICCGCNWKVDFLGGFRYLQLDEDLQIVEDLNIPMPTTRGGGRIVVMDQFTTHNKFYGGQLGVDAECRWGRWFVSGTGKLALGNMEQTVAIDGATIFSGGANPGVERGGLLAQQGTNIGRYSRDTFCVIPELGLRLGFYFTERLRGYVGYDVMYVSSVVRPGDQIDTNVNPTFLARNGPAQGAPLPRFDFHSTDFWAQGVSFGLEWRY